MHKYTILLVLIFLLGLFLRTHNLKDNIFFGYDQARDAQRIREILVRHDFKLVGPETDIPGVFNGPLLYYLLLPVYGFSNFNPNWAAVFLIFLNLSGIFLIYILADKLFGSKTGLLAAFIWAISYEQANYAKYISNASLMPLATLIFFLGCALFFLKNDRKGLVISIIGLGLSIQFNFYLIYLAGLYAVFYYVFSPKITKRDIALNLVIFLFFLSPFLLSEFLWGWPATKALAAYFREQSVPKGIIDNLSAYIQSLSTSFYNILFSFNSFIFFILLTCLLIYNHRICRNKKQLNFLYIWLLSTLPLFGFNSGVVNGPTINSSISGAIIIIYSLALANLLHKKTLPVFIVLFLLVILSNLNLYRQDDFANNKLLGYQNIIFSDEKNLVDYTYRSAGNKPFSICALTNPLFINTLWSFLYKTYGENKFHYLPYWSGQAQYLNINYLPYDRSHVATRFLIVEPLYGMRDFTLKNLIYAEDKISTIKETKKFGGIMVQKRELEPDKSKLIDSQQVPPEEAIRIESTLKTDPRYSCYNNY